MLELAAHILDIAENSVRAGANSLKSISLKIQQKISLSIEINDDGQRNEEEEIKKVLILSIQQKQSGVSAWDSASCRCRSKSRRQS